MPSRKTTTIVIPPAFDGARLDAALTLVFPHLGLRQRRALWERMEMRVQGRSRLPAFKVRAGNVVEVVGKTVPVLTEASCCEGIRVVARSPLFLAVCKPCGVHSVRGTSPGSVEEILPRLVGEEAVLLNRLDYLTSGLLLAARSSAARDQYLALQAKGLVRKVYMTLVRGEIGEKVCIRRAIDTSRKKKVRVLREDTRDVLRHTRITPLESIQGNTLVKAEIHKGQRHQIRAHLASLGTPIVGDPLYGESEGGALLLHHVHIALEGFQATCLPPWLSTDDTEYG